MLSFFSFFLLCKKYGNSSREVVVCPSQTTILTVLGVSVDESYGEYLIIYRLLSSMLSQRLPLVYMLYASSSYSSAPLFSQSCKCTGHAKIFFTLDIQNTVVLV